VEAANARMADVFRKNSAVEWVKAELEFHELIWELSGNRWLADCLKRVMVPYFHYETAFRLEPQITDQQFAALHQIYVDFLKGTSSHTAEQCVRIHLSMPADSGAEPSREIQAAMG
jgi:DNA-binding GntR family transcriptional regulator